MWPFPKKKKCECKPKKIETYTEKADVGLLKIIVELENGTKFKREYEGSAYFSEYSPKYAKEYGGVGHLSVSHAWSIASYIKDEIAGRVDLRHGGRLFSHCGGISDGKGTIYYNTKISKLTYAVEKKLVNVECKREVDA